MGMALERSYSTINIKEFDLEENCCDKRSNYAEAPQKITEALSDLVAPLSKLGLGFFPNLPIPLKYLRCSLNILDLNDIVRESSYVSANLRELEKINKVLIDMLPEDDKLNSVVYGLDTNALVRKDYEKLYRYYFSDYNAMKKLSKRIKKELKNVDEKLRKITDDQDERNDLEARKKALEESKLILVALREKVICNEAFDINKSNKKKCFYKFCTTVMSFIGDIVSLVKFSILKNIFSESVKFLLMIGTAILKIFKIAVNKDRTKDENRKLKIENEDDKETLVMALKVPSLFFAFLEVLDKHLFKKIREKAEDSRRQVRKMRVMRFLKEKVGKEEIDELIKGKEDLNEQIELLENDPNIQNIVELSKQQVEILWAEPEGYLSWKYFKIKTLEDEERIENVAKFVVKHIKELYLLEANLEEKKIEKQNLENQLRVSYNRIKAMVLALGIEKDRVDEFINNIKEYKKRKLKDIAMSGEKGKVSPQVLESYKRDKNRFIEDLKKAMKSEEEGE